MTTHVYFDLDGTLTDPYEGISKCILHAVDKLGFAAPSDEFLLGCIGPPLYDTLPEVVGGALTNKAINLYRERFNEVGWLENQPYEGIHDALAAVANSGCSLYVATSKPRIAANRIIEHFEMQQYFEKVYGSELDGTRSEKADLLRYAISENPSASRRMMIGDRKHDIIGAIANGILPIGVSYGYGSVDELTQAGAVAIAKTPAQISGIVVERSES